MMGTHGKEEFNTEEGQQGNSSLSTSDWEDDSSVTIEEENPHETPEKEILWAVLNEKRDLVEKLIKDKPSLIHVQDIDGYTPLHRASYSGFTDIAEMLLSHGAEVSSLTNDLWQPLHSAVKWSNTECADLLLRHGADVNAQTKGGLTPLHLAAANSNAETLQLLLMHPKLRADLRNGSGETAYQIAVRSAKLSYLFGIVEPAINAI